MKTVFKSLATLLATLALATSAWAQFNTDEGTGDADVKLDIKSTGPGAADLTFTGVKLVYLNRDPKIPGLVAKPDVSGKGKVWIVDPKAAPAEVAGAEVHLSGIGKGGWAVLGSKVDTAKTKSAPLTDTLVFPITIKGTGACIGLTMLLAKDGEVIKDVWVAKPGVLLTRGNGAKDHTLVVCSDQQDVIAKATPDQVKGYAPSYTAVTTASNK